MDRVILHADANSFYASVECLYRLELRSIYEAYSCRVEAASLKAGGQGTRYTCRVQGQTLYLFNDAPYWFIEV